MMSATFGGDLIASLGEALDHASGKGAGARLPRETQDALAA